MCQIQFEGISSKETKNRPKKIPVNTLNKTDNKTAIQYPRIPYRYRQIAYDASISLFDCIQQTITIDIPKHRIGSHLHSSFSFTLGARKHPAIVTGTLPRARFTIPNQSLNNMDMNVLIVISDAISRNAITHLLFFITNNSKKG